MECHEKYVSGVDILSICLDFDTHSGMKVIANIWIQLLASKNYLQVKISLSISIDNKKRFILSRKKYEKSFYIRILFSACLFHVYIAAGIEIIEIRSVPMLAQEKDRRNVTTHGRAVQRGRFCGKSNGESEWCCCCCCYCRRVHSLAPIAISRLRVLINPNCTKRTDDVGGREEEKWFGEG